MQSIIIVLVMVLTVGMHCSADNKKQQQDLLLNLRKTCYQKLGIPTESDMLERLLQNKDITYSELEMKLEHCGLLGLGWMDSEGSFQRQTITDFLSENHDPQLVKEVIDLCIQSEGETILAKVEKFYRCYFDNKKFEV